jgi:hypothetical protein
MNATQWRRIALFVEGEEDRAFAERVLKPRLLQQYSEVRVHMHAQTPDEKLSSHFRSLQRMNSDYFLVVDKDRVPCISEVRRVYARRYQPQLGERQVLVACPMIEAWVYRGRPHPKPVQSQHPSYSGGCRQASFCTNFRERAQNLEERIILLQQILDVYDWNLALQRSESLRYCATRLELLHSRAMRYTTSGGWL